MNQQDKLHPLKIGIPVLITIGMAIFILALLNHLSSDKIRENAQRERLRLIHEVLPENIDNDIFADQVTIKGNKNLGLAKQLTLFRIMQHNEQTGIVLLPVITRGYNGPIELVISIMKDGSLSGVRVIRHEETKGMGDGIDHTVSDWILMFTGRSLTNPANDLWAVQQEGGEFDQLSGATITSRSVINIIHKVLNYHALHQKELYQ